MLTDETGRLARVAETYDPRATFDYHLVKYGAQMIFRHAVGPAVLEMGCSTGVMTEELVERFPDVVVVDGSAEYLEAARRRVGGRASFHLSLFEEFVPDRRFNAIIMANILEHVADPVGLLRRSRAWLAQGGAIHIIVPNAGSLHRRVGVAMGLLSRLDALNARDLAVGHRRVYTFDSLSADIHAADLAAAPLTGFFLKPLPNDRMQEWPQDLLDALFEVGKEMPAYGAHIYARCVPHDPHEGGGHG